MRFEMDLLINGLTEILTTPSEAQKSEYTEFELLKLLQQPPYELFSPNALNSNLGLFQTHFTLFHALYLIQQQWLNEGRGYLSITALKICLQPEIQQLPVDEAETRIRDYYLDLSQLSKTNEQAVDELLDSFWEQFGNLRNWQIPETSSVNAAFSWFELGADCSWQEVKSCYHRVLHRCHPDKGGNMSDAQSAVYHFDVLKRYFKTSRDLG